MKHVIIFLLVSLWVGPAAAQVYYIRNGGTASKSGTGACVSTATGDWATANACDDLPTTLVRGATYYFASGTYAGRTIDTPASGDTRITLKKATASDHGTEAGWSPTYGGGAAVFATLVYHTRYIDTYGLTVSGNLEVPGITLSAHVDPALVAFLNFYNLTARNLFLVGEDILFSGGSIGNYDPCTADGGGARYEDAVMLWDNSERAGGAKASSRITFDGVTIHDLTDHGDMCAGHANAGIHSDCMQILGGHSITIRNSLFYNCATSDIMANAAWDTFDNFTLENNWLQSVVSPGASINSNANPIGGTNVIRYNTILGSSQIRWPLEAGATITFTGNIFGGVTTGTCAQGTWDYNLFGSGSTCGTHAQLGTPELVFVPTPGFQNGLEPDYNLTGTDTLARDRGNPMNYPVTDRFSRRRYAGAAPDLGASEYNAHPAAPANVRVIRDDPSSF